MDAEEAARQLAIIHQVVDQSRQERTQSGDIYIVWGVLVCICIAGTLVGDALEQPGWMAWPLLMPIGAVYASYVGRKREAQVGTYMNRVESRLWISAGFVLFGVVGGGMASGALSLNAVIPIVSGVIGIAMVTSGALYKSGLMTWPGWMFIILAMVCFLFPWQMQYAAFGLATIAGYIIPGILMIRQSK